MMGEYAFGAGEIVNRLLSICFEEISLVGGVKDEVKKLETVLRVIQAVLHDAERKQGEREVVRQWLHQLKQVAYDAEDVLDEVAYKKLKYSVDNMTPRWLNPKRGIARLKIAHKIKAINKRLAEIYENMKLLQLVQLEPPNNDQSGNSSGFGDNRETASDVNESAVIGRDKDKEKIIKMLINDDDAAAAAVALSVIAIVGLGGIGKTTLAQLVYNDGAVKKHFELKAWVCVSTKFKVENLFSQILQLINENSTKTESSSKEVLQKELRSQLGGKKFLLVLDDDWNEDETKWEDFLLPFMTNAAMGSKIIVTTRDRKVASVKGAHHALYLEGLSGEDCWGLIENQAFKRGGPLKTSRLVEIGREISKKCHGVPLAAKVLGGLLCSIKEGEWWGVLKDEIMSLDQRDLIKNVLKLSYDNLSPALQACFSYCAIFPKDYLISTELLIQLWMAQGLLEAPRQQLLLKACNSQRKLTLEDAGTICFDALYSKSFFQEAKMNKYGEVTHCKIHHHLHDLAQSIMDSECQVMGESSIMRRTDLSECRHVSMISLSTIEALDEVKKLRTIFGWESTCKAPRADALFKFKSLRVLDLSGFRGNDFSYTTNSFKYLKHLRYLDLSYTSITSLPTWVTGLYHLQTLKLIECRNLTELPEDLMKLKQQLRHLFIDDYKRWKKMPQAIGELHQLQTLPFFVGHEGVGISVFKNLNELRGALDIHRLRLMKEESLAKRVIKPLREKSNLRELRLHWDDDRESSSSSAGGDGSNDFNVLEELQPQTNLQWLSVEDYCGVEFPGWMSSGSDLPNLKKLELRSLPNLKEWWLKGGVAMLPCLEELLIENCPNLRKTPQAFPSLKSLYLRNVGGMAVVSLTTSPNNSLTSLAIVGCKDLEFLREGLVRNNNQLNALLIAECPKLKAIIREEGLADEILANRFLRKLEITESDISSRFPREGFLRIENCPELETIPKGFLSSLIFLESFKVRGCGKLKYIEVSHRFKNVGELEIWNCPNFEGFNHNLTTDQQQEVPFPCCHTLEIRDCPAISSIPNLGASLPFKNWRFRVWRNRYHTTHRGFEFPRLPSRDFQSSPTSLNQGMSLS